MYNRELSWFLLSVSGMFGDAVFYQVFFSNRVSLIHFSAFSKKLCQMVASGMEDDITRTLPDMDIPVAGAAISSLWPFICFERPPQRLLSGEQQFPFHGPVGPGECLTNAIDVYSGLAAFDQLLIYHPPLFQRFIVLCQCIIVLHQDRRAITGNTYFIIGCLFIPSKLLYPFALSG